MKFIFTLLFSFSFLCYHSQTALDFNGSSQYLITNNGVSFGSAFTFEMNIKYKGGNDPYDRFLCTQGDGFGLSNTSSGQIRIISYNLGINNWVDIPVFLPIGTFVHLAVVYNPGSLMFIVNGSVAFTMGCGGILQPSQIFLAGNSFSAENSNCQIDNFRYWKVFRTPTEIANNYQACLTGSEANLAILYEFNEASGLVTTDLAALDGIVIGHLPGSPLWVTGVVCTAPEINLQGNSNSISDGDLTPVSTDHTDFGSQSICSGTIVRTFTIQNTGTANLTLSNPTISGTNSGDFSINANPITTVAATGSTTFQVTFNPSASGTRTATISISNNDSNEGTYDFAIQGTGVDPEINVQGNGNNIVDGDPTPTSTDHSDFGSQSICSGSIVKTFTIQNTGTSNLTLSNPTISGTHSADFSITANPSTPLAASGSTTFNVTFDPSAIGIRSANISFTNNDCNEATYDFAIQGTGTDGTPNADAPSNIAVCNSYILPSLSVGNYFTGTGGSGTPLSAGNIINSTQTIFVYAQNGSCSDENSFTVTIKNSNTGTDVIEACNSHTWIDGITYTSSNSTATFTLTNAAGCDSIVTLNLTINNSNTGTDVQTACNSYTWIDGITYTSSNSTATFTLTNADGCDSIVTLNLTIKNSNTGTDVQTACNLYTWIDGITYTSSNSTATFTLTNAAGCDSIVTLNLTIKNSNTGTDVQTACNSFTWIDGITYTSSNSNATFTLTNAAGCDSIVSLNLTIKNSNTGTDVKTSCESFTWINGITYTASNSTATFTLANAAGCDSIVTLNLTIQNCTTLVPSQCNITLTDNSGDIYCGAVAGATIYEFRLVNGATTLTIQKPSRTFKPAQVAGCNPGTTYQVSVRTFSGSTWTNFGTSCPITTQSAVAGTKIQNSQCGITLANVTVDLYADAIINASQYKFKVTNGASVQEITKTSRTFKLSQLATVHYGATVTVEVDAFVNGAWIGYGAPCGITMPALPTTKLQNTQCGITLTSTSTLLYADQISGATQYRFRVKNVTIPFADSIVKTSRVFRMSEIPGLAVNTTYQVDVAVNINGSWQAYGVSCNVTTPAALAMMIQEDLTAENNYSELNDLKEIDVMEEEQLISEAINSELFFVELSAYPNPNNGAFTISSSHEGTFNIVNELGQLVQTIEIIKENNLHHDVEILSKGVYFVTGVINNEVITEKVIVL
jgi:hypothetical protein